MKILSSVWWMFCASLALPSLAATIPMGTAHAYAVLGSTTVTNTGSTHLEGDLGVYPGTAINRLRGGDQSQILGAGTLVDQ